MFMINKIVKKAMVITTICITMIAVTAKPGLAQDLDSNIYYNNGHFGTGLSTPSARFHIFDDRPTGSVDLRIENKNSEAVPSFFSFNLYGTNYARNPYLANTLAILNNNLKLPVMVLTADGRVGIGTDQPKAKFHVNGNIKVNSIVFSGANPDPAAVMPLFLDAHSVTQLNTAYKRYNQWDGGLDGLNRTKAAASLRLKALAFKDTILCDDIGALPSANFTKANIVALGIPSEDTKLTEVEVDAYVANDAYFPSANFTKANVVALGIPGQDTVLDEIQVDNYVSNNGFFSAANFTKANIVALGIPSEDTQLSTQNAVDMIESQSLLSINGTVSATAINTNSIYSEITDNTKDTFPLTMQNNSVGVGWGTGIKLLGGQSERALIIARPSGMNWTSNLSFYTHNENQSNILGTDLVRAIYIDHHQNILFENGSVGIGTSNPSSKLDVNGSIKCSWLGIKNGSTDAYALINTRATDYSGAYYFSSNDGTQAQMGGLAFGMGYGKTASLFANNGVRIRTGGTDFNSSVDRLIVDATGKVGIGTPSPSTALEVAGTISANSFVGDGSQLTGLPSNPWSTVTNGIAYNSGRVGIGTTTPVNELDVRGPASFGGGLTINDFQWGPNSNERPVIFTGVNGVNGYGTIGLGLNDTEASNQTLGILLFAQKVVGKSSANAGLKAFIQGISAGSGGSTGGYGGEFIFSTRSDNVSGIPTERMRIDKDGNVGIGTTIPQAKLDITGQDATNQTALRINSDPGKFALSISPNGDFRIDKAGESGGRFIVNEAGSIGIGTNSPSEKMEVVGTIKISSQGTSLSNAAYLCSNTADISFGRNIITFPGTWKKQNNDATSGGIVFAQSGFGIYSSKIGESSPLQNALIIGNYENGHIGIGTDSPGTKLTIAGIDNYMNGITIQGTSAQYQHLITAYYDGVNPTTGSGLQFKVANNNTGGNVAVMTLKGSGKVGIGTTTPEASLHVAGMIKAAEVNVPLNAWADFVFEPDYELMPIPKLAKFVKKHKHLPDIPSEKELKKSGLSLAKIQNLQMQKIEELTLYIIQLYEENKKLKAMIAHDE